MVKPEDCPRMVKVTELAVAQGLDASQIECPQRTFCDGVICPTSAVEVFDARLDKTRSMLAEETLRINRDRARGLEEARIGGQYFSNGDRI